MSAQAIAASSSNGVTVTSGAADTKGNYSTLIASTTNDVGELHLILNNAASSNRNYLIDIATGAAASETVLIPNIGVRNLNANKYVIVKLGVNIAAGTRISARCQDPTGSGAIKISGIALTKETGDLRTGVSSSSNWVNPLANTTGSVFDVSVDGGGSANTYSGTAGNICNANAPIAATHMIVTTRDAATASGADAMVRIKLNGTVITGVENIYHKTVNSDGSMRYHGPFKLPTAVAVNDTITAEVSSNTTTVGGREVLVGVILVNFPAASGGSGGSPLVGPGGLA